MSNVGIDTWNLISGTIGVITVLPFIWAFVRYQHPETKMAELDSTLKDTEALLRSVSEEGLLDPQHHVPHFTSHLTRYRTQAEAFRGETFIVSVSWRKVLKAWSNGLSKRIATLCAQVKEVRAEICETSAERRMQLMNEGGTDDAHPVSSSVWHATFMNVWKRLGAIVSRAPVVETMDTTSTSSTTSIVTAEIASSEDMRSTDETDADARTPTRLHPHAQSRKASTHRLTSDRTSFGIPSITTHPHNGRMSASAIRRVDQELTTQGVSNALLAQLAQAARRQWSPASTKAHRPRLRKHRGSGHGPKNVAASRHASHLSVDSGIYSSSSEETACEV